MKLEGVLSVLCTPFHEDGTLDVASLERLIEHNISWGVSGVVCFGLAGEIYKLTDPERATVLDAVVARVAGRVPVIAGTEHTSIEGAVQRTRWAENAGADAVMVYPPTFVKPDADGVLEYYTELSASSSLPIIVQDAPAWTGVSLPLELLGRIRGRCHTVTHVKVEAPPTAPKLAQLPRYDLRPVGGYGALHLGEELLAGIDATMPGCAMPGLYVDIMAAHARGDDDQAWSLYTDALPLLTFQMGGLDVFVAAQKLVLHRIGVLASTRLRRPGAALTADQVAWLDRVIDHRGLSRYVGLGPG
jgi:dihydrodipicolinate synthase/N-acetylneuraminate lyase